MWNSLKSVQLSSICTKLVIALVICCAFALPTMMGRYSKLVGWNMGTGDVITFMVILYICCIPALIALFSLHRVLDNIKKEEIFISKNVTLLRIISWCCFAVAAILVLAGYYYIFFLLVAVVAAFIGLILRVVKNVIQQAAIIKTENDFTI